MFFPLVFLSQDDNELTDRTPFYELTLIVILDPLNDFKDSFDIDSLDHVLIDGEA